MENEVQQTPQQPPKKSNSKVIIIVIISIIAVGIIAVGIVAAAGILSFNKVKKNIIETVKENEVAECKYLKDITDDEETNNELYKICTSEDLEDLELAGDLAGKSIKIITKEEQLELGFNNKDTENIEKVGADILTINGSGNSLFYDYVMTDPGVTCYSKNVIDQKIKDLYYEGPNSKLYQKELSINEPFFKNNKYTCYEALGSGIAEGYEFLSKEENNNEITLTYKVICPDDAPCGEKSITLIKDSGYYKISKMN